MGSENKQPKRLTQKQINQIMQEIDIIKKHYKQKYSSITIEKNYEKHRKAIKEAIKHLKQLIEEASEPIKYRETIKPKGGRPKKLTLEERALLLLIKEIFGISNRMIESMLMIFSLLSNVEVSYKTIERLYRDEEVMLLLHNLFICRKDFLYFFAL